VAAERARYWALIERHKLHVYEEGDDLPEIRDWQWRR
jgi:xylulose-5-phosphate/fructose-6-phosphate phosphoketolase